MSDESMWSEWDMMGIALEEAEEYTSPEGDGVLHPAPPFEEDDELTEY